MKTRLIIWKFNIVKKNTKISIKSDIEKLIIIKSEKFDTYFEKLPYFLEKYTASILQQRRTTFVNFSSNTKTLNIKKIIRGSGQNQKYKKV